MSKEIPKEVKTFVRATLISASSGIKQTNFPNDYEKYAGTKLEWRKMGFKGLYEFLLAIPDVARLTYSEKDQENLVFGVTNKEVYASSHAQKAAMKGTTGPKHKPPSEWGKPMNTNSNQKGGKDANKRKIDVAKDLSTLKVTVGNKLLQLKDEGLCPNLQGLYGIHISNLPKPCTKEELEHVFQGYPSLKECKLVSTSLQRNACAFVKFTSAQDALMALRQKNGYQLKGSKLKLNKAKEGKTEEKQKDNQSKSENKPTVSPGTLNGKQSQNVQSGTDKDHSRTGSSLSSNSNSTTSLERLPSSSSTNTLKQNGTSIKQDSSHSLGGYDSRESQGQQSNTKQQSQKQQQLQQQQNQQQQQQQEQLKQQHQHLQNTGHFPSHRSSTTPASTSVTSYPPVPIDKSVHLILSKEEMDRMNRACGHQIDYRLDKLPLEFDVLVTEVIDTCHFWAVIDFKTGNWSRLEDIEKKIQPLNTRPDVPQRYTVGAGRFTENNAWYRCFVLDVSYDGKHIKVLYTDYGNAEWIPVERFTTLDQQLWSLPPQANPFHLAGLELSNQDVKNVEEGAAHLKRLICNKTFIARKKPTVNQQQPHIVEVELFDRLQQGQSVNSLMTATKFVKPVVNPVSISNVLVKKTPNSSEVKKEKHIEDRIKISITWVYSPQDFHFQLVSTETKEILKKIGKNLNQIPLTAMIFPKVGLLACYVTMDHGRNRVKILEILKSNDVFHTVTMVKVLYLDSGMVCDVPVTRLLKLPPELLSIPMQATRACLADVGLPDGHSSWPIGALQVLLARKAQTTDAKIVSQLQDGRVVIELYDEKGENMSEKIMNLVKPYGETKTTSLWENKRTASKENLKTDRGNYSKRASGQDQASSPKETTAVAHPQKAPIAANFAGNQSNSSVQATGNQVLHNSQSEKAYHPSSSENPHKPVTSDKSRVVTQGQNHSHSNSATNTTSTYNYYMPPPPRNQTVLPSVHTPHTGHVYQGLPLGRSAVDDRSARDFSYNERLPSHPRQNELTSSIQNNTSAASYRNEESGALTRNQDSVVSKHQDVSPVHRENNPTNLTEKERNEKITNGKEFPVATKQDNKEKTGQEWIKEKELLLARKQSQENYLEILSKRPAVKPAQNNLQELKLRLEKQVRIKELENRALKLRKEIETLEAAKAELQYQLMNS